MPRVRGLRQKYQAQGLGVIGVHPVDRGDREEQAAVREAVRRYGMTDAVYLDEDFQVQRRLRGGGYPSFFVVDRQGMVRYRLVGALGGRGVKALETEIEARLKE